MIDAHQHFWYYLPGDYEWIDERMSVLKKDYLPADLWPHLQESGIVGTIAVQARQTLAETQWLLSLSDEFDFIKGVVGWVDLCSDDLSAQLEGFVKHPRFKGVRHVLQDEPDDRFMLREDFLNGVAELAHYDMAYDLLIFARHLPCAIELVSRFPGQTFIVDHLAKPDIKNRELSRWKQHMSELATFPNVFCKLSGMVTEVDWKRWRTADFVPWLEVLLDVFGADRLMIGSDWPVCLLGGSYQRVLGIVLDFIASLPQEVKTNILEETVRRAYRLELV